MQSRQTKLFIMLLSTGLVLLLIGAFFLIQQADRAQQQISLLYSVPEFNFVDQNGNSFGLPELQGRITVVDFIFTSCQGPCPILSSNMAELYRRFDRGDQIQFVSISVDPQRDTAPVLATYASRLGVTDNRWLFLRGNLPAVASLIEDGFKLPADNLPGGHSTKFVLVDQNGYVRGYYDGTRETSLAVLQNDLSRLAKTLGTSS